MAFLSQIGDLFVRIWEGICTVSDFILDLVFPTFGPTMDFLSIFSAYPLFMTALLGGVIIGLFRLFMRA